MKSLLIGLLLLAPAAQARVAGKLDLSNPAMDLIVFRELHDGMWLGGAQKTIWKLMSIDRGVAMPDMEVMHVAAFWASRPEVGSHKSYGLSIGLNVGGLAHDLALKIAGLAEVANNCPPWVAKIASWTSLDNYVGYRPVAGYDEHHLIYGIGGKVTVPLDQLWTWIRGTPATAGDATHLGDLEIKGL